MRPQRLKLLPLAVALACASLAPAARADERESLEALRQTTLSLIQTLVDSGVLTREKADALLQQAQQRAAAATASAAAPAQAASGAIRVPYVPQVVRDQIRNEIKEEVLAQAREERWGVPNAKSEWTDRIKVDGDIRLRYQADQFGRGNPTGADYVLGAVSGLVTRAPDFATTNASGVPNANTTEDRTRLRARLRLGVTAKITDSVSTGVRLATGSATDRVSTNQTLGQDFNKYQFYVDRAFIRLDPTPWLTLAGGRIPNPWFSTDLVWSDNLNFEGLAATAKWPTLTDPTLSPFLTVGAFPFREDSGLRKGRWLHGVQLGLQWQPVPSSRLKFGLARYSYGNVEGRVDNDFAATGSTSDSQFAGPTYGQYEYTSSLRQKGNTLFQTNDPSDTTKAVMWGLASKFQPLVATVAGEFSWFDPVFVMFSAEYATNTAFDRNEIQRRTGIAFTDGRKDGTQLRVAVGAPEVRNAGDWQVSATWRRLGSDAVLDAFTDSDFGLGGTNNRGYILGVSYGLDKDLSLGVRYLSSKTIDSPRALPGTDDRFSVNSLQVDLNARF